MIYFIIYLKSVKHGIHIEEEKKQTQDAFKPQEGLFTNNIDIHQKITQVVLLSFSV